MAHVDEMPLMFALELVEKAAEERQTQAAWEMYVAIASAPRFDNKKLPTFAEYLDSLKKGQRRDVRRAQMTPEEIERKFDAIVAADLQRKAG